jgi:soluble lytic murein transglycosylase-like protein
VAQRRFRKPALTFVLCACTSLYFGSFVSVADAQSAKDRTLSHARQTESRDPEGRLEKLPAKEHLRRASVYMSNRAFAEAREHWEAFLRFYPEHSSVPEALLGIGRSYYQSRRYSEAFETFENLARRYSSTKEGREGLNFSGSALLRLGRPAEAVTHYIEYIDRYPNGERIDTAHLNVIDSLREAGRPQDAVLWVTRTTQRFAGTATETNAKFARLRLDVAEGNWEHAITVADELTRSSFSRNVLTSIAEVTYLKGFSLEHAHRRDEAIATYLTIPDSATSYYGWLATERVIALSGSKRSDVASQRLQRVNDQIDASEELYPAPYRQIIVRASRARKLDPRFMLAIIRQESVFKPFAKSPAGARGLLQLTIDAAQKYAPGAGLKTVRENELYQPETSILVGSEYLAHLVSLFPKMLEPVAASYNGGEDNVARWVKRAKHNDTGVFTSEVGFDETKDYVQKVMTNYRAYKRLYSADLVRQ